MNFDAGFLKKKHAGPGSPGGGYFSNSPIDKGIPAQADNMAIDRYLLQLQAEPETAGVTLTPAGEQGTQGHRAPWQVYHDYPMSRKPWAVYDPAKDPSLMNNPKRRHVGLPLPSEVISMIGSKLAAKKVTDDDPENPMCLCGHKFYEHNEQGYCDICDPESATKGPEKCGGFMPLNGNVADVHMGAHIEEGNYPPRSAPELKRTAEETESSPTAVPKQNPPTSGPEFEGIGDSDFVKPNSDPTLGPQGGSIITMTSSFLKKQGTRYTSAEPNFGLRWAEFDKNSRIVTKEKWFTSSELREGFANKVEAKDNFKEFVAWSNPREEEAPKVSAKGGFKWSPGPTPGSLESRLAMLCERARIAYTERDLTAAAAYLKGAQLSKDWDALDPWVQGMIDRVTDVKNDMRVPKISSQKTAALSPEQFRDVMSRQPKEPGADTPFLCSRCGDPFSPEFIGFVDRKGLPVHEKCGNPPGHGPGTEVQEYKDANKGWGYQLSPEYFQPWQAHYQQDAKNKQENPEYYAQYEPGGSARKGAAGVNWAEYAASARELLALIPKDANGVPEYNESYVADFAAATGLDADYLNTALLREMEARKPKVGCADAGGIDVAAKWDSMTHKQRQSYFRMGNALITYRPWSELDQRERELIMNAARIRQQTIQRMITDQGKIKFTGSFLKKNASFLTIAEAKAAFWDAVAAGVYTVTGHGEIIENSSGRHLGRVGKKANAKQAGTWGERSYDSDQVHDILDAYRTKPQEGGLGFDQPVDEDKLPQLQAEVERLFSSNKGEDKQYAFGVCVFLVEHQQPITLNMKAKAIAAGQELLETLPTQGWKDPKSREQELKRELKFMKTANWRTALLPFVLAPAMLAQNSAPVKNPDIYIGGPHTTQHEQQVKKQKQKEREKKIIQQKMQELHQRDQANPQRQQNLASLKTAHPLRFVIPTVDAGAVTAMLHHKGLSNFMVEESEHPGASLFEFKTTEERNAAKELIKADFQKQIQEGKGWWTGWQLPDMSGDQQQKTMYSSLQGEHRSLNLKSASFLMKAKPADDPQLVEAANALVRYLKNTPEARWASTQPAEMELPNPNWPAREPSAHAGIRDWGQWEIPPDAEGDTEDYDWKVMSHASGKKLDEYMKKWKADAKTRYPGLKFEISGSEKNWLEIDVTREKKTPKPKAPKAPAPVPAPVS